MGAHPKPNAKNREEKAGAYVPTTVRYRPRTLEMLDDLVRVWTERHARPFNRTTWIDAVITAMHEQEFGATPVKVPTAPTTPSQAPTPGEQPKPPTRNRRRRK